MMVTRSLSLAVVCVLASFALSCVKKSTPGKVLHDARDYVRGVAAGQWQEVTRQQFIDLMWEAGLLSRESVLDEEHPITRNLQDLVDQIDHVVRSQKSFAGQQIVVDAVPRPRIMVSSSMISSAFVAGGRVCSGRPIEAGYAAVGQLSGPFANSFLNTDGFLEFPKNPIPCVSSESSATFSQLTAFFNSRSYCSVQWSEEERRFRYAPECRFKDFTGAAARAENFSWMATLPYVYVSFGMLSSLQNEEELTAVLSHELSHYYRAHGSLLGSDFNFFYRRKGLLDGRPKPDPTVASLGASIIDSGGASAMQRIPGQRFHSSLYLLMARTATDLSPADLCRQDNAKCLNSCQTFQNLQQKMRATKQLAVFPWQRGMLSDKDYLNLENRFNECAAVATIVERENVDVLLESYDEKVRDVINGEVPYALSQIVNAIDALERRRETEHFVAADLGLGYYTREEEADDMAIELIALLGIDPNVSVLLHQRRGALLESQGLRSVREIPMSACSKLLAQRWHDDYGRQIFVPVASFVDEYSSPCYRVYNLDQEIKAHHFLWKGRNRPKFFSVPWRELLGKYL